MIDKNVRAKAKKIAWDLVEPTLKVFFEDKDPDGDLSKIIAGAIENVILEEWCKFNEEVW